MSTHSWQVDDYQCEAVSGAVERQRLRRRERRRQRLIWLHLAFGAVGIALLFGALECWSASGSGFWLGFAAAIWAALGMYAVAKSSRAVEIMQEGE